MLRAADHRKMLNEGCGGGDHPPAGVRPTHSDPLSAISSVRPSGCERLCRVSDLLFEIWQQRLDFRGYELFGVDSLPSVAVVGVTVLQILPERLDFGNVPKRRRCPASAAVRVPESSLNSFAPFRTLNRSRLPRG
jgi:hypothetical protein